MSILGTLYDKLKDILLKKRGEEVVPLCELSQHEVEDMLDVAADNHPEKLNWRTSIVDLQKLVGMDSSFEGRRAAAEELDLPNYQGTSEQNIELHKRVMAEIAKRDIHIPQP